MTPSTQKSGGVMRENWPDDASETIRLRESLDQANAIIADAQAESERLRAELRERRACLVGAKQTVTMARETLTNAQNLDLVRLSLDVPLAERSDLLDQAIAATDEALDG